MYNYCVTIDFIDYSLDTGLPYKSGDCESYFTLQRAQGFLYACSNIYGDDFITGRIIDLKTNTIIEEL